MDLQLFISTFCLIFIAELPDKTALATVMMATRGRPWPIFVGVAAAFLVQTLVAAVLGKVIGQLPAAWVHCIAGLLFLGFAYFAWFTKEEPEGEGSGETTSAKAGFGPAAWAAFMVIFIAEWGDLTQLATASLIARYHEKVITIFVAALLALWSVTALAIFLGSKLKQFIKPELIEKIAAVAFAGIGVYMLYEWANGR